MKKLTASTLVETLTAATILSIVAGLGIMVFLRLSSPASSGALLLEAQAQSYAKMKPDLFLSETEGNNSGEVGRLFYESQTEQRSADVILQEWNVEDANKRNIYTRKRLYYVR